MRSSFLEMASSQHVEVEAARLLQKLIQESKDEPAKLATKLYMVGILSVLNKQYLCSGSSWFPFF